MKHVLSTGVFCIIALGLHANTFFVKNGGAGMGNSWTDASGSLASVLSLAQPGDEIWVAKGIYYPTSDRNRDKSFTIPSGVRVYGGFAGGETSLQNRNFKTNHTILSGNIGSKTNHDDNSYTVVLVLHTDGYTLIDGFIITEGNANGAGPTGDMARCGAGIYIDGSGANHPSKPVIQNCVFEKNTARDGGAAYLNGKQGLCNPTFRNCQFLNNKAGLDGGAVFNDGRQQGEANPNFEDCVFAENEGNYGGALCNYGGKGESSPKLQNCQFRSNEAHLRGGAMFNMDVEGETLPVIINCQFEGNKAVAGQSIYTFGKPETVMDTAPAAVSLN